MSASNDEITAAVKALAMEAGFAAVGIAPAGAVPVAERYHQWIARGCHGGMEYLSRNTPQRLRPDVLVPSARSVICLAVGYGGGQGQKRGFSNFPNLIARYAQGRDYHKVLKKRCIGLMDRIGLIAPEFAGRAFVDSAPIMERSLAASCGLGCIARNGLLVVPHLGSYCLLCEIVCNLPLAVDSPPGPADRQAKSACENCGRCRAACPTGVIDADGMIDARRCVSYLTIEHSGPIAPQFWPMMGTHVFGCDACQDACPLNAADAGGDAELAARENVAGLGIADILQWTPADWDETTRGSAMRRGSYEMFIRNAIIAAGNSADESLIAPLQTLRGSWRDFGMMIDWAIARLNRI
jgi:epoxyqueuosine reductase